MIARTVLILCSLIPIGSIADTTTEALIKQVDYLQKRHEIIASNIANVSTPKYSAQDIERPEFIPKKNHNIQAPRVRLRLTNAKHLQPRNNAHAGKYQMARDDSGAMKPNKNNVDLSKQVEKIAINADETATALKNYRSSIDLLASAAEGTPGK